MCADVFCCCDGVQKRGTVFLPRSYQYDCGNWSSSTNRIRLHYFCVCSIILEEQKNRGYYSYFQTLKLLEFSLYLYRPTLDHAVGIFQSCMYFEFRFALHEVQKSSYGTYSSEPTCFVPSKTMNSSKEGLTTSGGHATARHVVVIPGRGVGNATIPLISGQGSANVSSITWRGHSDDGSQRRPMAIEYSRRVVNHGQDYSNGGNNAQTTTCQPQTWESSEAKRHLQARLDNPNDDIHQMLPEEVYKSCELYHEYKKANFKSNLRRLKAATQKKNAHIEFDRQAVDKLPKRPMVTNAGHPFWDGSDAQRILKLGLLNGEYQGMKPMDVYNQNNKFKKFPLHIFRNHFYKAQASKKSSAYWQMRQKLKKNRAKK